MSEGKAVELDKIHDASLDGSHLTQRHQSDSMIPGRDSNIDTSGKASSTPQLPLDTEKRHVSIHDSSERSPWRTSTQMSRKGGPRKSVEFDRRTDGPFGRPSITMTRRASQPQDVEIPSDEPLPVLPVHISSDAGMQDQSTTQVVPFQPEPPPLNYDLWCRKWWIIGFWTLVVFDSVVCPVVSTTCITSASADVLGSILRSMVRTRDTRQDESQHCLQYCHSCRRRHEYCRILLTTMEACTEEERLQSDRRQVVARRLFPLEFHTRMARDHGGAHSVSIQASGYMDADEAQRHCPR